jgi:hypothetical protein
VIRISYLFVFFFFMYLLNQFSFIFYNFSWFSLLCTLNLIDFYKTFNLFLSYSYLYLDFSFFSYDFRILCCHCDFFNMRWYNFIENNLFSNLQLLTNGTHYLFFSFVETSPLINFDSIYCIYFDTKVIGNSEITFYILQNKLFILPGETSLCFFRLFNNNPYFIQGVSIYTVSPFELNSFVNKIQCFCFEEINLSPHEILELPVLFFLDSNINFFNYLDIKELCVEYILLCNKT